MIRNHTLLLALIFSLLTLPIGAQTQTPEEAEALAHKVRNMPNIEVGKGVSFMPKDSLFKVNLRFRMQNMVGFQFDQDMNLTQTDLMVKRLRLRFDGYMYSPKFTYSLQLGFTPYDTKNASTNDFLNIVRDAMVYYIPSSNFNIGFGQTKIQANRARMNSSSALQFVDRSIVNSNFQIDRDFGLFAAWNRRLFRNFNVVTKGSVTSGEGRNYGSNKKFGLAYTGRVELFPLGRFKANGDIMEGDFERELTPRFMVAGAYSYNQNTSNISGQLGEAIFNEETRNISSYFIDFIFKCNGFAFYVDYMGRNTNASAIVIDKATGNKQYMFTGQGINVQTSYIFKKNWEIALRNSTLLPNEEVQPLLKYKNFNQTTVAVTKYLIGHSLKLQMDLSYNAKSMINPIDKGNGFEARFQVELGL